MGMSGSQLYRPPGAPVRGAGSKQGREILWPEHNRKPSSFVTMQIHMVANARLLVVLLGILGLIGLGQTGARAT